MTKKRHQALYSKPQSTAPSSLGASASASSSTRKSNSNPTPIAHRPSPITHPRAVAPPLLFLLSIPSLPFLSHQAPLRDVASATDNDATQRPNVGASTNFWLIFVDHPPVLPRQHQQQHRQRPRPPSRPLSDRSSRSQRRLHRHLGVSQDSTPQADEYHQARHLHAAGYHDPAMSSAHTRPPPTAAPRPWRACLAHTSRTRAA